MARTSWTVALFAILVSAAALRLAFLHNASIWYDEAYSIKLAEQPLGAMINHMAEGIGEPVYPLLLKAWITFSGRGERNCALLSILFSSLNVFLVYQLGRSLTGSTAVGCISSLLLAFNPQALHYASNVRNYPLLHTISLLSYYYFLRCVKGGRSPIPFICVSALGFYTHTQYYFVCWSQGIVLLVWYRQALRRMLIPFALVALLYLPWFSSITIHQMSHAIGASSLPRIDGASGVLTTLWAATWSKLTTSHMVGQMLGLLAVMGAIGCKVARVSSAPGRWTVGILLVGLSLLVQRVLCAFEGSRRTAVTVGFVAAVVVLSLPSYRWELLGDLHGDREAITAISDGVGNEDIVVYSGFSALAADYYFEEFSREPGLKFYFPLELDPRVSGVLRLFTTTLLEYREEKGADFAEQASSVTKSILSEDFDEVYLFHATDQRPKDWEIVRHMGHALDSTLELVRTVEIRQHTWGPLYDQIRVYRRATP